MDLYAAIRAKVDEISQRLDDDCNMQCGVSCASQGYDDVARALLAVLELHMPREDHLFQVEALDGTTRRPCKQCSSLGTGGFLVAIYCPCPTVLAIAKAFGIEP